MKIQNLSPGPLKVRHGTDHALPYPSPLSDLALTRVRTLAHAPPPAAPAAPPAPAVPAALAAATILTVTAATTAAGFQG